MTSNGLQFEVSSLTDLLSIIRWDTWFNRISQKNAWVAVWCDGDYTYETRIALCLCAWMLFYSIMKHVAPHAGRPLSARPTIIANTLHSGVTSVCAFYFLVFDSHQDASEVSHLGRMWQTWVLPFTLSYLIQDFLYYCIPRRDLLISVHHLAMILCHFDALCLNLVL